MSARAESGTAIPISASCAHCLFWSAADRLGLEGFVDAAAVAGLLDEAELEGPEDAAAAPVMRFRRSTSAFTWSFSLSFFA